MMKEKIIKLWMVAMGLLLSVQAFSAAWDDYDPYKQYSMAEPQFWVRYFGYHAFWAQEIKICKPYVLFLPSMEHYWQEETQTCRNNAYLAYIFPEYIDSVTKKTDGILTLPDTIHFGPSDSIGAAYKMIDVGEGLPPLPLFTNGVKLGNVYQLILDEGTAQDAPHFYWMRLIQQDTVNAGKIKYYRTPSQRVKTDKYSQRQYQWDVDTLLTGCYTRLPITSIDIKGGTTSISPYTFWKCPNLTSVHMPKSLKRIKESAFEDCTQLENMILSDSINFIGESAFKGCTRLKNITLPESLLMIDTYAFSGCSSLESITIPANVKVVGSDFLAECENLKTVIMEGKKPCGISYSYFSNPDEAMRENKEINPMAVIYVPKGCAEAYRNSSSWSKMKERIFDIGDPAAQEYINGIHSVKAVRRSSATYDLQGRRVDADRLQQGSIYIENGKKIRK